MRRTRQRQRQVHRNFQSSQLSALRDLGLNLPGDAEIDLVLAYISGDYIHIVNKAENQLTKDVDIMMAILATLACFPDASSFELQNKLCSGCLETWIVSQEDLADLSLLQKKTQVPDKPDPATTSGKKKLLTLTARLLSHQSLLHIGYREVEDKEKLVTERHRYNLESVDGKIMQKEFVVASPQQQQVIANFTASSTKRHLVLEGLVFH